MARTRLYPPSVDPGFPALAPSPPERWRRTTFRSLLEVIERPVKLTPDATYRLVTAKRNRGGIILRSELPGRGILTKTQFEAKAGDFLISRRQIIHGACGVVPEELDGAIVSNEYSTLRTHDAFLMEYLRHFCHSPYFQRTCFHSSHGVDVEKMIFKLDEWLDREVDVPPLAEQGRIAASLSSVDDAIDATQSVIDQLQVVKKAMMSELLTRGLPGRHTRFKQTEIGEVPESWELVRLADAANIVRGSTPRPAKDPRYFGGDAVPWITVGELSKNEWPYLDEVATGLTDAGRSRSRFLESGTVVLSNSGFGCGVPKILGLSGCANDGIAAFLDLRGFLPTFLYYSLFSMTEFLRRSVARGVDQPNLNTTLLGELQLRCPPEHEQHLIVESLLATDERLRAERHAVLGLSNAKSALMSALLTGEVRVKPDSSNGVQS